MDFAVIFTYSFDDDVAVYLFETFEAAQNYLLNSLYEEHRIDVEENGWDSYFETNEDKTYGRLITQFPDHDDIMEIRIGNIYR